MLACNSFTAAMSDSVNLPLHLQPAKMVAGKRRRGPRRSSVPRSNTAPGHGSSSTASADDMTASPLSESPTLTLASTSTSSKEGKKKHGMFGFKSKDQDRPSSSRGSPLPSSPLPPCTPVKAAQFLGVDTAAGRARSSSLGRRGENNRTQDLPDTVTGQSEIKEQSTESDQRKHKNFWSNSGKKAQRMLGISSPRISSPLNPNSKLGTKGKGIAGHHSEKVTKQFSSSMPDLNVLTQQFSGNARPVAQAPSQRSRKKVPKTVDKMTPITETSHDELRNSYNSNWELDLIQEYADDPFSTAPLGSTITETPLSSSSAKNKLGGGDLSSTDRVIKEEDEAEEPALHRGSKVSSDNAKSQHPQALHVRGPLQTVEDLLLDATEEQRKATNAQLDAYKNLLDMNDWQRRITDAAVAKMKAEHEAFKDEYAKTQEEFAKRMCEWELLDQQQKAKEHASNDDDDDDDLPSIRSSIDLEEEPTLHIATAMPILVVKPGMVKLVDIPPRRKKPVVPVDPVTPADTVAAKLASTVLKGPVASKPVQSSSGKPKLPLKPIRHFQPEEGISPFNERSTKEEATCCHACPPPLPAKNFDSDESVDEATPPPPLPKDDYLMSPTSPHPPRSSSKEHHCIRNGHVFYLVELNKVPDETRFNSLGIRPYLRTPTGIKQHVHVPVLCDNCDEDVRNELWKCSIPNCSVGVCQKCAEDMEHEWVERVTKPSAH
ncbi:duf-domain-containing protein [Pyrenophora seminiperda CCB06]|uniref:Duf-domain-containing protein n=1 Tax=Pyrenophora seminiperda CCB06 TaxID=1302712 RepID=A0A3M7MBC6_9PLEO|nr:duf-domain-containing protein [Pyrenophora seminiperda CCB06]